MWNTPTVKYLTTICTCHSHRTHRDNFKARVTLNAQHIYQQRIDRGKCIQFLYAEFEMHVLHILRHVQLRSTVVSPDVPWTEMVWPRVIPYSHYSRECASVRIDAHSRIRTIHTTPTMRSEAHSMPNSSEANRILEFVSSTQILEYGLLRSAIWLQSERYRSEAKRIMTAKVVSH